MTRFLLVCLGGAIGSGARYGIALWAGPWGTPVVNLAGSFLIGIVMQVMPPNDARLFLTTGLLGGFTTYSAFNYETTELFRAGAWLAALLNIALTLFGCLIAGIIGMWLARAMRS